MSKLDLMQAISLLDDNSANIRKKFLIGRRHFVSQKDNPVAYCFLELLCSEHLFSHLNEEDFSIILESVVPEDKLEYSWLIRYCEILLHTLNILKPKVISDERAGQYEKYLMTNLVPDMKKLVGNSKVPPKDPAEVWLLLTDIYKISAALF